MHLNDFKCRNCRIWDNNCRVCVALVSSANVDLNDFSASLAALVSSQRDYDSDGQSFDLPGGDCTFTYLADSDQWLIRWIEDQAFCHIELMIRDDAQFLAFYRGMKAALISNMDARYRTAKRINPSSVTFDLGGND